MVHGWQGFILWSFFWLVGFHALVDMVGETGWGLEVVRWVQPGLGKCRTRIGDVQSGLGGPT